ncbi:MAG: ATP-dependent DNA helicase RecG, partial [Saezia sp.]
QMAQFKARAAREELKAPILQPRLEDGEEPLHKKILESLPFELTVAQKRVVVEIMHDLAQPTPMHRLLQGDVGSGKTIVAALAAAVAMGAGWQCALMVPTEILAQQHFVKLVDWLTPHGVKVAWLIGAQKKAERAEMLELIASGKAGLVVGTHAVIQEQVQFKKLGLVIIDEQHRFGVAQRLALRDKLQQADVEPHFLMMSATPIPRTLAMSYYADLDVSTIDELPPGRTPVVTRVFSEQRKPEVVERIDQLVKEGRQVYWVCPLIEESEVLDLSNATATHTEISEALPHVSVGLLHSRMPAAEKKDMMAQFVSGKMSVLVSTTVIEVGVDVPNASLMVIDHAERFGLSQLHQLRGRVGRGSAASICILLFGEALGQAGRARLKAMVETHDGFEIARRDLEIRGPGEFLGARQSGDALLRFADLSLDDELLVAAKKMAPIMLREYPKMADRHIERWMGTKAEFLKA